MKIKERMVTGKMAKARANPYMATSPRVPFGYEKVPNPDYKSRADATSIIRPNERDIALLRMAFNKAHNGWSCQRIADWLTGTTGKKWDAVSVLGVLRNRVYIGERRLMNEIHQITPVITREEFDLVQQSIQKRRCAASEKHFNPLKGILKCGKCGRNMTVVIDTGTLKYQCMCHSRRQADKSVELCGNSAISMERVINAVYEATRERLQTSEYYGQTRLAVQDVQLAIDQVSQQLKDGYFTVERKKDEIAELQAEMGKTGSDLMRNLTQTEIDKRQAEIKAITDKATSLQAEWQRLWWEKSKLQVGIDEIANVSTDVHQQAAFFNKVLERVEWSGELRKRCGTLKLYYKNGDEQSVFVGAKKDSK